MLHKVHAIVQKPEDLNFSATNAFGGLVVNPKEYQVAGFGYLGATGGAFTARG